MSPHPSATAPPALPLLPRQIATLSNDPYGLSSIYAGLTSLYPSSLYPGLYSASSYSAITDYSSYYSSLLGDYTSILGSELGGFSLPTAIAPLTNGGSTPTSAASAANTGSTIRPTGTAVAANDGNSGGMSTGAKIGVGVGVTLGVLFLAAIGILIWCMGKRKGKKSSTTIVGPPAPGPATQHHQQYPVPQQHPQMGYADNHGMQTPPPHYAQPQPLPPQQQDYSGVYGTGKVSTPDVPEMEHQYHTRPGAVEIGDGLPQAQQADSRP